MSATVVRVERLIDDLIDDPYKLLMDADGLTKRFCFVIRTPVLRKELFMTLGDTRDTRRGRGT